MNRDPCGDCEGRGRNEKEASLNVTVPAGVDTGMRLRLAGEGEAGSMGGPAGDLFVVMAIEEHDLFQRDGVDLHLELPVSVFQAMLGARVPIKTILGEEAEVAVNPGAQPGEVVRLSGSGMPHVNGRRRGDLYVHMRVVVPAKLSSVEASSRRLIVGSSSDSGKPLAGIDLTPVQEAPYLSVPVPVPVPVPDERSVAIAPKASHSKFFASDE